MATFVSMLVALTFIDLRHYIIPDEFSISPFRSGRVRHRLGEPRRAHPAIASGSGVPSRCLVGGGGLALIMGLYWLVRREEGMGWAMWLLMMMIAFLGTLPAIPSSRSSHLWRVRSSGCLSRWSVDAVCIGDSVCPSSLRGDPLRLARSRDHGPRFSSLSIVFQ